MEEMKGLSIAARDALQVHICSMSTTRVPAEDANTIIDSGDEGEEEAAAKVYAGFERSFELARARISSGHIDGLFGFSQGVCFASILAKACASEL